MAGALMQARHAIVASPACSCSNGPMRRRSIVALALALAVAAPAGAQETGSDKSSSAPAPSATAPSGSTGSSEAGDKGGGDEQGKDKSEKEKPPGVTGGYSWSDKPAKGKAKRRHVRAKKFHFDPNAPVATYPGFRMLPDGSSQLWVQVNRKVPVTASASGSVPSYVLVGAQITNKNNTRWLLTEYFDTPVARARLRREAAGAQLVIELRENVTPKYRTVDGPGGTMILYVDLPKSKKSYAATQDDFAPKSAPVRTGRVLPGPGTRTHRSGRRGPNP
jgi:hypothetical protein